MQRTQIYLTDSENESIKLIIKQNGGGTKADIIRRAIDEYINRHKQHSLFTNNYNGYISPGLPAWADKLPEKLDIGKRIKIVKGFSWVGKSGIVTHHYINNDDCGDWGKAYYGFTADDNHERYSARVENCEFIN